MGVTSFESNNTDLEEELGSAATRLSTNDAKLNLLEQQVKHLTKSLEEQCAKLELQ